MRLKNKLAVILATCFMAGMCAQALAQDINFRDLSRQGRPVIKRYVVEGILADGREYLEKFDGIDTSRVQASRAAAAQAAAYQAEQSRNNSSNASSKASVSSTKSMKTYACVIYCNSASGPKITREVSAATRSEAAKYMGDNADSICKNTGYQRSSSHSFAESQCRER